MEGMEDPKADSEEKNKQDAAVFSPQWSGLILLACRLRKWQATRDIVPSVS